MNIGKMFKGLWTTVTEPSVLIGIGITGFFTAIGFAIVETPKAEELITKAEDEKGAELTTFEKVKAGHKAYAKTAITAGISAACIIGASHKYKVRNAELATLYAGAQAAIRLRDEKTAEIVGEEKAEEIKQAVNHDMAKSKPVQEAVNKLPSNNNTGMHPYYDPISNTAFYATETMVEQCAAIISQRLYCDCESYVSVSEMYDELNELGAYPPLKHTAVSGNLGWTPEHPLKFDTTDKGTWDDGTPCYILGYHRGHEPIYVK